MSSRREQDRRPSGRDSSPPPQSSSSSSEEVSLSVEETNKLRASLGLPPLRTSSKPSKSSSSSKDDSESKESKEAATTLTNPRQIKQDIEQADKLRHKILDSKIQRKLKSVKTLGDESDEEEGDAAASWVIKSRQLQIEKEKAAQREKELEEQENRMNGSGSGASQPQKKASHSLQELKGVKVAHDVDSIEAGEMVILTLKDDRILHNGEANDEGDDGEQLESTELLEKEKRAWNLKQKEKKSEYSALNELNKGVNRSEGGGLLSKYDDENVEFQRKSFALTDTRMISEDQKQKQRQVAAVRAQLRSEGEAAAADALQKKEVVSMEDATGPKEMARDFYTPEEEAAMQGPAIFKQKKKSSKKAAEGEESGVKDKKKKKKLRKAEQQQQQQEGEGDEIISGSAAAMDIQEEGEAEEGGGGADWIAALEQEANQKSGGSSDHGSRRRRGAEDESNADRMGRQNRYARAVNKAQNNTNALREWSYSSRKEDEDDEQVFAKIKQVQPKKQSDGALLDMMEQVKNEEEEKQEQGGASSSSSSKNIVFNPVAEFVRGITKEEEEAEAARQKAKKEAEEAEAEAEKERKRKEKQKKKEQALLEQNSLNNMILEDANFIKPPPQSTAASGWSDLSADAQYPRPSYHQYGHPSSSQPAAAAAASISRPDLEEGEEYEEEQEELHLKQEDEDEDEDEDSDQEEDVLAEKSVAKGVFAALQAFRQKGSLEPELYGRNSDVKLNDIGRSYYKGEKDSKGVADPAPKWRLEHYDEFGRPAAPKEAYRHISHVFHNRFPSKKKREKALKKVLLDEQVKKRDMSQLPSVQALQAHQDIAKSPFLILHGSNNNVPALPSSSSSSSASRAPAVAPSSASASHSRAGMESSMTLGSGMASIVSLASNAPSQVKRKVEEQNTSSKRARSSQGNE